MNTKSIQTLYLAVFLRRVKCYDVKENHCLKKWMHHLEYYPNRNLTQ